MRWRKLLPLLGLGLFAYLVWRTGLRQIWHVVGQMDWRYLAILPIPLVAMFVVQTLKWDLLLRGQNIQIGFADLLKMHMMSFFYALLTPGRVGYLMKISFLRDRTGRSWGECSSSVIVDRFLDMMTLLCFAAVGSLLVIRQFSGLLLQVSLVLAALVVGGIIFSDKGRARSILKLGFDVLAPKGLKADWKQSFHSFYDNMPALSELLVPLLLTILNWVLIYTHSFMVARSLSIDVNYPIFIFLVSLGTIAGLLPITVSGLGTREATLITLFSTYGVPAGKIISMSLVGLLVGSYIPALFGGALVFRAKTLQARIFRESV